MGALTLSQEEFWAVRLARKKHPGCYNYRATGGNDAGIEVTFELTSFGTDSFSWHFESAEIATFRAKTLARKKEKNG